MIPTLVGTSCPIDRLYWIAIHRDNPPDPLSWDPEERHLDREHLDSLHGDHTAIFEVCRGDWDTGEPSLPTTTKKIAA